MHSKRFCRLYSSRTEEACFGDAALWENINCIVKSLKFHDRAFIDKTRDLILQTKNSHPLKMVENSFQIEGAHVLRKIFFETKNKKPLP